MIFYFTGLPLCKDTEDITVPPVVTDVPYSIVPTDAKMVRAKSRYVNAAAEIHSYIPVLTVISLMLQLWDLFIKLDVILAIIITLLQKSLILYVTVITITIIIIFYIHIKPYRLLVVVLFFFWKRLIYFVFFYIGIPQRKYKICILMDALIIIFSSHHTCYPTWKI